MVGGAWLGGGSYPPTLTAFLDKAVLGVGLRPDDVALRRRAVIGADSRGRFLRPRCMGISDHMSAGEDRQVQWERPRRTARERKARLRSQILDCSTVHLHENGDMPAILMMFSGSLPRETYPTNCITHVLHHSTGRKGLNRLP